MCLLELLIVVIMWYSLLEMQYVSAHQNMSDVAYPIIPLQ